MKIYIEGNLPHWLYKKWLNSVRVTLGQADESGGFLGKYNCFKQQNDLYMLSCNDQTGSTTSVRGFLFKLKQIINIQIPIAIELHIIYYTTPRFRPSTII